MLTRMNLRRVALGVVTVALSVSLPYAFSQERTVRERTFSVHNKSDLNIVKLYVSEDGKKYGFFDIGRGIKAGATVKLFWDISTNGESCEQYVKAIFSDGQESEPAVFNFCEEGLQIEFQQP